MVYGLAIVASNDSDIGFTSDRRMVAERAKSTTLNLAYNCNRS